MLFDQSMIVTNKVHMNAQKMAQTTEGSDAEIS